MVSTNINLVNADINSTIAGVAKLGQREQIAREGVGLRLSQNCFAIDLKGFFTWLETKDCSEGHKSAIIRYAQRLPNKFNSPIELAKFLKSIKPSRHYVISLANYFQYAEENGLDYEAYRKVLKFEKTNPDLRIPSDSKVVDLLRTLSEPYETLGLLVAYSGLRLTEALELIRSLEPDKFILRNRVVAYPISMLRGSKNAFFAYMPSWLASKLENLEGFGKYKEVCKQFIEAGLPVKYLRKWQYNALVRAGVDLLIAEFIQGRTFKIVGGTNYLGAFERAVESYSKALPFLERLLQLTAR